MATKKNTPVNLPSLEPVGLAKAEVHHLSPHDILVDENYQRPLDPRRIRLMSSPFDPEQFGVLEVNFRESGDLYVVDGQHRLFVAKEMNLESVPVKIHFGLSAKVEALLFLRLNANRLAVSPLSSFRAGVFGGDPIHVAVRDLLASIGFKISTPALRDAGMSDTIMCVHAVMRVYRMDNTGDILKRSLLLYAQAWSNVGRHQVHGQLLLGLAYLLARMPDVPDKELAMKMSLKMPNDVLRTVRALMSTKETVPRIAIEFLNIYNSGRRTRKLDPSALYPRSPGEGV